MQELELLNSYLLVRSLKRLESDYNYFGPYRFDRAIRQLSLSTFNMQMKMEYRCRLSFGLICHFALPSRYYSRLQWSCSIDKMLKLNSLLVRHRARKMELKQSTGTKLGDPRLDIFPHFGKSTCIERICLLPIVFIWFAASFSSAILKYFQFWYFTSRPASKKQDVWF